SGRDDLLPFGVVLGPEFRLEFATEALHRTRCDDSLRSAPDTEQHVDTGRAAGSGDGARHIAVGDEPDPGPCPTYLFHQLVVARAVQNAHGDIGDVTAFGAGDTSNVLRHRSGNVHAARCLRADGEFLHVEHRRRVEHRVTLGDREHGQRVGHTLGHQCRTVDRVDRHVTVRTVAVTDLLAVEQHGRLVLLALTDDDDALHRHGADELAHGVDGGAVAGLLLTVTDPTAGRHGGGLRDPDQFHCQVAV